MPCPPGPAGCPPMAASPPAGLVKICGLTRPQEAATAPAAGGTGVWLALAVAREARQRLAGATMVLAGGLTPQTVAAAVALVRPEVVDVSSGVERLPGIKDPDKIARFLEAVFGHSAIS